MTQVTLATDRQKKSNQSVETSQPPLTLNKLIFKASVLGISIFVGLWLLTFLALGIFAWSKFSHFAQAAQVSTQELKNTLLTGWHQEPLTTQNHENLLILGLDQLPGRGESTVLTDTIMILSLDYTTGQIKTLALPRDLWSQAYQTKINALYTYGLERQPNNPSQFPQEVLVEMTGLKIHHTLTISMQNLAEIIDLLGGVEVKIKQSFTDEKFPRPEIDVTQETRPEILYETVSFTAGTELMSGQRALKYMRSRHGDHEQNTDLARSQRQQVVLQALAQKMLSPKVWLQTKTMGQLYRFYLDYFSHQLPPTEIIAALKKLWPLREKIRLTAKNLSVYPDDPQGLIEHPPEYRYDGQWVYVRRNPEQFKQKITSMMES